MYWNEDEDILDIIGAAKERLLDAKAFEASLARGMRSAGLQASSSVSMKRL
jgi:hypothetical protein